MVMISYNEAIEMEVTEVLEHCALKNYTQIMGTYGKGTTSGTHRGDDIWPGRNNMLLVACEDAQAKQLFSCVSQLRKSLGTEGVKAFIMPLEALT